MTFVASKRIKKIVYREEYERDKLAFELARQFQIEPVRIGRQTVK
jgi:hypothetical protein